MTISKLAFGLMTVAIGVATAASSYSVTISSVVQVGQTQLKPGDYKVSIESGKAVFKSGKQTVEVPATVENGTTKYSSTILESNGSQLQDIQIGGTNAKIVFKAGSAPAVAGQ